MAWRRGARAGYLPQDVSALTPGPLLETVLASVPGRSAVEARLRAAEEGLHAASEPEEQLELAQELADLHAELDHFEERHGRHHAERLLGGLGFSTADLARDTATLSGGWRMRAALAGLLLQDPDLLLLDEPTNHLDVPTLTWFDAFLRASSRALVLICHDREFLNRQIGRVLALEPEGLRSDPGDYDALPAAAGRGGGAPRGGGGEAGGAAGRAAGLHRPLRRQEHQGAAGAEPAEDAGPHGEGGGAGAARHPAFPLRRGAAVGEGRAAPHRRLAGLRREGGLPERLGAGAARGAGGHHRRQRRGQDHAAPAGGGRARPRRRRGEAGPLGGAGLLRAAPFRSRRGSGAASFGCPSGRFDPGGPP